MKRAVALLTALILFESCFVFSTTAQGTTRFKNDSQVKTLSISSNDEINASGLILNYNLEIERRGSTTLIISGDTVCKAEVVKSGFKGLKVERRLNSSSSWSEFHDYGNRYYDMSVSHFYDQLPVDPGYQYRVTCKHYAKKNILNIQTISNASNIVTF